MPLPQIPETRAPAPFAGAMEAWTSPASMPASPMAAMFDLYTQWWREAARQASVFSMGDINIFFPFGHGFTLNADPVTNWWGWLTEAATGSAANAEKERRIVTDVASYGKQLGAIMDILIPIAEKADGVDPGDLARIKQMRRDIETAKRQPIPSTAAPAGEIA